MPGGQTESDESSCTANTVFALPCDPGGATTDTIPLAVLVPITGARRASTMRSTMLIMCRYKSVSVKI